MDKFIVFTHLKDNNENWYYGTYDLDAAWNVINNEEYSSDAAKMICLAKDVSVYQIKNFPKGV